LYIPRVHQFQSVPELPIEQKRVSTMKALSFVVMAVVAVSAVGAASSEHFLDLTKPGIVATAPAKNVGHGIGHSGGHPPALPLRLTLSRLDRQVYVFGSAITYEVTVENIGEAPFKMPWSVDRARIEGEGTSFLQGFLSLLIVDPDGGEHLIGTVILDGSELFADTLETVLPGEIARIRTREQINVGPEMASRLAASNPATVRAVFAMDTTPIGLSSRVISENALPATLRLAARR